ncbi:hypothetical protein TrCOL_g8034, partial [Triparma columacea]
TPTPASDTPATYPSSTKSKPKFSELLMEQGLPTEYEGRINKGELNKEYIQEMERQAGGVWDPNKEDGGPSIDAYLRDMMSTKGMKKCLHPAIKLMLHDLIPERGTVPCCPISGIPFTFVKGGDNPVSINRKNNTIKDHTLDNIEIIASRFNVPQHQAIPNIKEAFKDIFRDMRRTFDPNFEAYLKTEAGKRTAAAELNLKRTPKKNGVTADQYTDRSGYNKELKEKDLTNVISAQVSYSIDTDAKINKWTAGQQKTFRKRYGKE